MASEKKMIFARVDDDVHQSIQSLADARFNGKLSDVVREGSKLYVELRTILGPHFEIEMVELRRRASEYGRTAA